MKKWKFIKKLMTFLLVVSLVATFSSIQTTLAASPVDVIDSIVITQESNTNIVLAEWNSFDSNITVNSAFNSAQAVKLFINWSDKNGAIDLQEGDFFTFVIPELFNQDFVNNVSGVEITNNLGEVVATYSIYDNVNNMKELSVTFTDFVDSHTNIFGDFWILLFVGNVNSTEEKLLEFVINGELKAEGIVTVNPVSGTRTPRDSKNGYSSPTSIVDGFYIFEWYVYVNMNENIDNGFNTLADFSFEDIIPSDSPHVFLTDEIRQELGLSSTYYMNQIGEYIGADSYPPENRYQVFVNHYNGNGPDIWYNFISWNPMVNGLTTTGIDGNGGLNVSNIQVTEKSFSANLGTLTRPTAIHYYTISTIKITESALGDTQVAKLFTNTFNVSSGQDLTASVSVYRFAAGGSAQGITGDFSFAFTKVDEKGVALQGAMFSLFTSLNFAAGANRFSSSNANGVVSFQNLPVGTYYLQESAAPFGYVLNDTIYKVVLSSTGFEIFYGDNFENSLSGLGNEIVNRLEFVEEPISVIFTGMKNLTGTTLKDGMFRFIALDQDGAIAATGTNDANGRITFSEIEFDASGVFMFTVEEVNSGLSGITYDGSKFIVTVTVTIGEDGNLTAQVEYPNGGIVFNNSFKPSPPKTGDKNAIYWEFIMLLALASLFGLAILDHYRKQRLKKSRFISRSLAAR